MDSQRFHSQRLSAFICVVFLLAAPLSINAKIVENDQALRSAFTGVNVAKAFLIGLAQAGDRLFATGQGGIILYSDDQGDNWTQSEVPIAVTITAITFVDEKNGWAVGHDMTIINTVDAGLTWQIQNFDPEFDTPLLDLWFKDALTGFAVGGRGNVMWTTDGGNTWQLKEVWTEDELVPDAHLFTIRPAPNGDLYMVAEVGTLFRSTDLGENWEVLDSPYRGSFFGMAFPSDDRALAFAMLGHAAVSDDQGDSWSSLSMPVNKSLLTSYLQPDGTLVLAGMAGAVVVSSDGGKTFEDRSLEQRVDITGLLPLKDGQWLIATSRGVLKVKF